MEETGGKYRKSRRDIPAEMFFAGNHGNCGNPLSSSLIDNVYLNGGRFPLLKISVGTGGNRSRPLPALGSAFGQGQFRAGWPSNPRASVASFPAASAVRLA